MSPPKQPLDLHPADGAILFFGTMNAMPMMYALELRKLGFQVVYYVDAPRSLPLHRPECHFPSISYPYPDWIVEIALYPRILPSVCPRPTLAYFLWCGKKALRGQKIQAVFMDGIFAAMAPFLPKRAKKIFLSYGDDLGLWCNPRLSAAVYTAMAKGPLWRLLPRLGGMRFVQKAIGANYRGAISCHTLICFPPGLSRQGDVVARLLAEHGVAIVRRYDASPEIVAALLHENVPADSAPRRSKLRIINAARNYFVNRHDSPTFEGKGNDIVIAGFAQYLTVNSDAELHLFEKGPDVQDAKQLAATLGIQDSIIWHSECSCQELLRHYVSSDICIDQVGTHWLSAVGIYAMYVRKPLIANVRNLAPIFGTNIPIVQAEDAAGVCAALVELSDAQRRQAWAERAWAFCTQNFNPMRVIRQLVAPGVAVKLDRQ